VNQNRPATSLSPSLGPQRSDGGGVDHEAERLAFMVLVRAEQNVTAARFYENIHFVVGSIAAGLAVAAGGNCVRWRNHLRGSRGGVVCGADRFPHRAPS
jgi:hypothetical protein